ncbi:MAG: lysophospholipid acyltransferase family protein [Gemmatimonadales bacterium]
MRAVPISPPIPPGRLAAAAFLRYTERLLRGHFVAVHWRHAGPVKDPGPVLFTANHTNWWDGFLAYLAGARLGRRFFVLMEESNLDRYRWFRRVGALPLSRTSPVRAWRQLRSAALGLEAENGLWMFPQGRRRPPGETPIRSESGAARLALAAKQPARICPVAFRYTYLGEDRPEAFILIGAPFPVDRTLPSRALAERIGREMDRTVDELDTHVAVEDLAWFTPLLEGRLSMNKRLDRLRHRLGFLPGPFNPRNG